MFRPFLRVAKPDDWSGSLAQLAVSVIALLILLGMLLAELPASWLALASGNHFLVRAALVLLLLYGIGWLRAIAFSILPRSAVLLGSRLRFRIRGRRIVVSLDRIVDWRVELRPPPTGEVFVVELEDGGVYDVCPVAWEGSERIHAKVNARLRARVRRGGALTPSVDGGGDGR